MAEPLEYFLTWCTYDTWLPGDPRGWIEQRHGWQLPRRGLEFEAAASMTEDACRLKRWQRDVVERAIEAVCQFRRWHLHAVNCRSNHVHLVVTANPHPIVVRNQLKSWSTRRLKESEAAGAHVTGPTAVRRKWWAEGGSQRYVNDEDSLECAIRYVRDGQDGRSVETR